MEGSIGAVRNPGGVHGELARETFRDLCDRALQNPRLLVPNLTKENLATIINQLNAGGHTYLSWWDGDARWLFYAHPPEVGGKLYAAFKSGEQTYKPRLLEVFTIHDLVKKYQRA